MPGGWARIAGLCALLIGAQAFGATDSAPTTAITRDTEARATLNQCAENGDEDAVGIEDLEEACPGVEAALSQLGIVEYLPSDWRETINVYQVGSLLELDNRFREAQPGRSPGSEHLQQALSDFKQTQAAHAPTLWERFKNWLRDLLGDENGNEPTWLTELLDRLTLPEAVMQIIVYLLLGLVVAIAIAIVVAELRAAGLFGQRSKSARELGSDDANLNVDVSLADLEGAPLLERPALMLRLLVAALLERKRLTAAHALTHTELAKQAVFPAPDGVRFERLVRLAERIRFGRAVLVEAELVREVPETISDAQSLYETLRRTAAGIEKPA